MTCYPIKNFTIVILFFLIIILVAPNVLAENQGPGTGAFQTPALKFDNGSAVTIHREFIVNPGGNLSPRAAALEGAAPRPPDNGYTVAAGSIIYHSGDNTTRIFDASGYQQLIINDTGSSSVLTPRGYLPATRVCQIPSGSEIHENGNVTVVSLNGERVLTVIAADAGSRVPTVNGWVEDSENWFAGDLAQFIAYWKVPVSPPSPQTNTVDFLFNAIQPSPDGALAIIQPVLEWNYDHSGTWTARSWYGGTNDQYYHTDPIYVTSGQTIEGTLKWDNSRHLWNITTADQQTGQSVTIFSTFEQEIGTTNLAAFCTYEAYNVYDNSDAPGTTTFYNMRFRDINGLPVVFPWTPSIIDSSLAGLHVLVTSQSMVTLQTANPGLQPTITGIVPATGMNNGPVVNAVISGTNFWGTPVAKLVRTGYSDRAGTSVTVLSPSAINASFNLTGAAAGLYTVAVINPDGRQALLPNGFMIKGTDFTAVPLAGDVPLTVIFTDTSTNLPVTWNWTFGDGNSTNSTVQNPVHTYWIPGTYTVTLQSENAGGNSSSMQKAGYIRATRPVPTINSITTPGPWYRNATINYTITGTKFRPNGTTVEFRNRSGLYLNGTDAGVTSVTLTTVNGQIHIPYDAPIGPWNISLTTTYGGTIWKDSAFSIQAFPKPVFTAITPPSPWYRNATVRYSITGSNFQPGNTVVTFWNRSGVMLNATSGAGVTSVTTTKINGTILIPRNASIVSPYNITIATVDGGFVGRDAAITVLPFPAPAIQSFTPATGFKNTSISFTLNGNNFQTAAGYTSITLVNEYTGEELYGAVTSATDTRITGTLAVPAGTTGGVYDLLVTTVDGGTAAREGALTLNYFPLPVISAINQTSGYRNTTVPFIITGTNFQPGGGTFVRINSTAGAPVPASLSSVTGTGITGSFAIPYNAASGKYRLDVLTVSGGSASRQNAFTVNPMPKPLITAISPAQSYRNRTFIVTVTGNYFQPAGGTFVNLTHVTNSTDISMSLISVTTTRLNGTVTVPPDAPTTPVWKLMVTTIEGGQSARSSAISIQSYPAPTFTSIAPNSGLNNTIVAFTVKGTNFQAGGTNMTFWNRTGNTVLAPTIISVSPTQVIGNVTIPPHANQSWYVNISTVDGGLVSKEKAFTVR